MTSPEAILPPTPLCLQLLGDISYESIAISHTSPAGPAWQHGRSRPLRLLDAGCGSGRDSIHLAHHLAGTPLQIVALDVSPESLISLAQQVHKSGHPIATCCADLRAGLPFQSQSFDVIFSHYVLSCNFQARQIEKCLNEFHRVLRPGGRLYLAVRSTDDPTYRAGPQRGAGYYSLGETGLYFFSLKQLRKFAAGFVRVHELSIRRNLEDELYGAIEMVLQRCSDTDERCAPDLNKISPASENPP